jgi:hypothetical protein
MSLLDKLDNPFIARLAQQEAMSAMETTCDEILSNPDPRLCIEALVSVIDQAKLALRPRSRYGIPQQGIHYYWYRRCIQNQKICFMVNEPFSAHHWRDWDSSQNRLSSSSRT